MASSEINPRDVVDALETLTHDQTKELYFHLGVDLHVMSNLASDYKGNMCKIHIVQTWFDKGVEVNWKSIIAGLKKIKMNALAGSVASQHNVECTDTLTSDLTNPPVPPPASGVTQSTTSTSESLTTGVCTAPQVTNEAVTSNPLQPLTTVVSSDLTVSVTTETASITPDGPGTSTDHPATGTTESAPSNHNTPDISSAHPVTDSPINPTQPVVSTTHPVTDSPINPTQPVVPTTHPVTDSPINPTQPVVPTTHPVTDSPINPTQPVVPTTHPVTDSPINPTQPVVPTTHPVTDSPINPTQPVVPTTHPVTTDRVKQVKEEIEQLQDSFTTIVSKTRSALRKKEAQDSEFVDDFRDYLLFFPASKKALHVTFFRDNEKDIIEAKNILTFIAILSRYCNYSNYEILLQLIKKFCEATLQKRMIDYHTSYTKFELDTTVDVYVAAISTSKTIARFFTEMSMKLNKPTYKCTLHDIRKLKEDLAEEAFLPSHCVYIKDIAVSSVLVVFSFPTNCKGWILAALTPAFLNKHHLTEVTVDGEHLKIEREEKDELVCVCVCVCVCVHACVCSLIPRPSSSAACERRPGNEAMHSCMHA